MTAKRDGAGARSGQRPATSSDSPAVYLLTPDDVAQRLGITRGAVLKARERGQLPPATKVGGRLRWRSDVFDEWLANLPTA